MTFKIITKHHKIILIEAENLKAAEEYANLFYPDWEEVRYV